jgi:poly(A) polymerase
MDQSPILAEQIAGLLNRDDADTVRETLVALLAPAGGAEALRALDEAGLLTRIIPELEPARHTDQPIVHFLPVLAHSLEAVTVVDWLLDQIQELGSEESAPPNTQYPTHTTQFRLPVAIQTHPELRYHTTFAEQLRDHFARSVGRYPRVALYRLGALLHDVAKPRTKRPKPGGGVSFHEHQSIGGEVALAVSRRLGFDAREAGYIRTVVREHMRPGQLAAQGEVTMRAVQRFFHDTGDAGPDVLLFLLADHMATRGPQLDLVSWIWQARWIDALLDTIWGEEEELTPPLLNGDDLLRELGLSPGPIVGQLLAVVGEAQAGQRITTRGQALALARQALEQLNAQ